MVGPFIFFDQMGPARLGPGEGIDVRPHPHINLATVTFLFAGTEPSGAHLIEEDERADHGSLLARQGAVDLEPAKVVSDGSDGLKNRVH